MAEYLIVSTRYKKFPNDYNALLNITFRTEMASTPDNASTG